MKNYQRHELVRSPSLARTAWLVVALLWPVALLNYLDRQMLASMKFSVMHDITDIGSEANWGGCSGSSNGFTRFSVRWAVTSRTASVAVSRFAAVSLYGQR
jgi:hypothetical protein